MAVSRYKFYDDVWNDEINHIQKGFQSKNLTDFFTGEGDILYTIPVEHVYRPDLISKKFFGDPKLYWILVFANNFSNCPEDFEQGIIIRVPRYERVLELL